jgi:hypothetical protein
LPGEQRVTERYFSAQPTQTVIQLQSLICGKAIGSLGVRPQLFQPLGVLPRFLLPDKALVILQYRIGSSQCRFNRSEATRFAVVSFLLSSPVRFDCGLIFNRGRRDDWVTRREIEGEAQTKGEQDASTTSFHPPFSLNQCGIAQLRALGDLRGGSSLTTEDTEITEKTDSP